jgi:hypothetical protein
VPVLHLTLIVAVLGEEHQPAPANGRAIPERSDEIIAIFEYQNALSVEFMALSQ